MGGNRARHSVQVDHCDRPTTHAIAAGVPPPPTGGPLLGPPTRPYEGRMEGHAEPHQGVADETGCTVPAGAGARTPNVRRALHRASALTEQLTDEVLDLALEPLRVLYPQTHIPPAGTSNCLGRLGWQRRVGTAHPGGLLEQWLTLRNPSTTQGHWYLHQLLCLPRAAPSTAGKTRTTRTRSAGAQRASRSRSCPPSRRGRAQRGCSRAPLLDTATTVQQRGSNGADGAEPDCTNCGAVAWTAACRHLARDTTGLRQYRPADRTALAFAVAAVGMGPVAAWPAQLLHHVPC